MQNSYAFFCQNLQHLRIVDERAIGIKRALLPVGSIQDNLDSPADSQAETCRLGELKLQHS